MEGLIPLVYRSLKKSHTRRKYECLSSGVAEPYNIADFYIKDEGRYSLSTSGPGPDYALLGHRGAHHWRSGSVAVDGRDFTSEGGGGGAPPPKKQLVKFRSHRMLSCITGA